MQLKPYIRCLARSDPRKLTAYKGVSHSQRTAGWVLSGSTLLRCAQATGSPKWLGQVCKQARDVRRQMWHNTPPPPKHYKAASSTCGGPLQSAACPSSWIGRCMDRYAVILADELGLCPLGSQHAAVVPINRSPPLTNLFIGSMHPLWSLYMSITRVGGHII
jgi:hypothetical protein